MDYSIGASGFEGRQPVLRTRWLQGPVLLLDGTPAPKGPSRGTFVLRKNDGTSVSARLVTRALGFDPIPDVEVHDLRISVVPPLAWWQWMLSGIPLLLVFIGGAMGGLIGAAGTYANISVLRSARSTVPKVLLVGATSAASIALFFLLRTLLFLVIGR